MNKLITFIIAGFVLAASVFAGVGESPAVSLADWRKLEVIPQGWEIIEGQPCLVGHTKRGNIAIHVFTKDRKYNIACILSGAPVTQELIDVLKQNAPANSWELAHNDTELVIWKSSFKEHGYQHHRMIAARSDCIAITNKAGFEFLSLASEKGLSRKNTVKPRPLALPPKSTPTPSHQNDCVLVATEALSRLKTTASWARMAGFIWTQNSKEIGGHAVVFFQPTQNTNVFMYDKSGSYEIPTKSHDLHEITDALNQALRTANIRVKTSRWLDSDGSIKEFADAAGESGRQPVWSATTPTSTEKTTEQIAIIVVVLLMLVARIFVVVICFLKGKSGFGGLGIGWPIFAIIGAIRIGKPHSWWARKYYGLEKMRIAHQRFTPSLGNP